MESIDLNTAMSMWFNMKYELYDKMEHKGSIYLYDNGDEYADIRILIKSKCIYYNSDFRKEFSEVFPVNYNGFRDVLFNWLESTLNLVGFAPYLIYSGWEEDLRIPNKNK